VKDQDDNQRQRRESDQVPDGHWSVADIPLQILLRDPTSAISALRPEEVQKLVTELEAGLAYARHPPGVASTGPIFFLPPKPRQRQLVVLWAEAQRRAWQALIEGVLPSAIVLPNGRIEHVSQGTLELSVEEEVFETGRLSWPVEERLVVAEQDLERWIRFPAIPAPILEPNTKAPRDVEVPNPSFPLSDTVNSLERLAIAVKSHQKRSHVI
jgi:hypothetical protein